MLLFALLVSEALGTCSFCPGLLDNRLRQILVASVLGASEFLARAAAGFFHHGLRNFIPRFVPILALCTVPRLSVVPIFSFVFGSLPFARVGKTDSKPKISPSNNFFTTLFVHFRGNLCWCFRYCFRYPCLPFLCPADLQN